MTIGARLLGGAFWTVMGAVLSRVTAIVTAGVLGRLLGTATFGDYGIVASAALLFAPLAGGPVGSMATRYVSLWLLTDKRRCGQVLAMTWLGAAALGLVLAVALWLSADVIAQRVLGAPRLGLALRLVAPYMLFGALSTAGNEVLVGFQAFRLQTIINWVTAMVALAVAIPAAWRYGLPGALAALVISAFLGGTLKLLASVRLARRSEVELTYSGLSEVRNLLWSFALPALLAGSVVGPVHWVGNALLRSTPDGATEMGLFHAANYLRTLAVFLPAAVAPVMLPLLVEALVQNAQDQGRQFRRTVSLNTRVIGGLIFPLAVALLCGSRGIMVVIYGRPFGPGWAPLALVAVAVAFQALASSAGQVMTSRARMWLALGVNCWTASVFIALAWLLTARWGAVGLAAAHALAMFQHAGLITALRQQVLEAPIARAEIRLLSASIVLMGVAGLGAAKLSTMVGLLLSLPLGLATLALLLLVGFDSTERKAALTQVRRRLRHPVIRPDDALE